MSIVFKYLKRLVIALFSLLIAGVIALLVWRMVSSGNPKDMERLTVNDEIAQAYGQSGDSLYMFEQKQRSITSGKNNYGYFSVTDYVIVPDANQIQLLFRYNTSTLKHTAEDFKLSSIPARDEVVYDVSVLLAIDLTPEDDTDNLGNEEGSVKFVRCSGQTVASNQKNMYNYHRMVFKLDDADVDIKQLMDDGLLLAVYADVCYLGSINYDEPYGTLCLYDYLSKNVTRELEKQEIRAIETYIEKSAE